ncbi:MAG: transglycosylase SLT domain-containing protein [Alphaproteobacteria bacterium]
MRLRFALVLPLALLVFAGPAGAQQQTPPRPALPQPTAAERTIALDAFKAIDAKDFARAEAELAKLKSVIAVKTVTWQILVKKDSGASFERIRRFVLANRDWPDQPILLLRAEETVSDSDAPAAIVEWFALFPPNSLAARLVHIEALHKLGRTEEAQAQIRRAWVELLFVTADEKKFLDLYRAELRPEDHRARLALLLARGQSNMAERLLKSVEFTPDERAIADVRIAMQESTTGAATDKIDAALAKLPETVRLSPDFLIDTVRWHRRAGRPADAAALLGRAPVEPGQGRRWWVERHLLIRAALEKRDYRGAYALAKAHGQIEPEFSTDGEWLAGWLALRQLNDPDAALTHFDKLFKAAGYVITKARGAYWLGRAYAAKGDKIKSTAWYRNAAQYPLTFYGQLASNELGQTRLKLPAEFAAPPSATAAFGKLELVVVARWLHGLKRADELRPVMLHLWRTAEKPADLDLVTSLATQFGTVEHAVRTAKTATRLNIPVLREGYPRLPLPAGAKAEAPLVLALIRQESEFYREAVSPSNARGLMQLLPRTAREEAGRLKIPYSLEKLTEDAAYNVRIGTYHFEGLLKRFAGSYVLSVAAYNAGASRVTRWLDIFGDPRQKDVDMIDWIETIPFSETRNYVQRVIENMHVYRQLMTGDAKLSADLGRAWTSAHFAACAAKPKPATC